MKKYQIIKPDYYDQFVCKGDSCKTTCCKGWRINLTKEEARHIKKLFNDGHTASGDSVLTRLPPDLRVGGVEYEFSLDKEQRCLLLTEDKLCGLQCKYGADKLPAVCRDFPRKICNYNDILFYTLSPGCEKVLEILLRSSSKISLHSDSKFMKPEKFIPVMSRNQRGLTGIYFDIINFYTALLQADGADFEERIILLGMGFKQINELAGTDEVLGIPAYCDAYLKSLETLGDVSSLFSDVSVNSLAVLSNLIFTEWTDVSRDIEYNEFMRQIKKNLQVSEFSDGDAQQISYSEDTYRLLQKRYQDFMSTKEQFIENVMLCFLYYCSFPFRAAFVSLWDNYLFFAWLYSIIKFSITAVMPQIHSDEDLIKYLVLILRIWGHNDKAGKIIVETLHSNSCDTLAQIIMLLKSC